MTGWFSGYKPSSFPEI